MKIVALVLFSVLANSAFAGSLRPAGAVSEGFVCGTVIKVGDLESGLDMIWLRDEEGQTLKIHVSSIFVAIPTELNRAAMAMAHDFRYCAHVKTDGQKYGLVRSSIEKK